MWVHTALATDTCKFISNHNLPHSQPYLTLSAFLNLEVVFTVHIATLRCYVLKPFCNEKIKYQPFCGVMASKWGTWKNQSLYHHCRETFAVISVPEEIFRPPYPAVDPSPPKTFSDPILSLKVADLHVSCNYALTINLSAGCPRSLETVLSHPCGHRSASNEINEATNKSEWT